jgi:hypothetical protein
MNFMEQLALQVLAPMAVTIASTLVIWILGEVARWVRERAKNERVGVAVNQLCMTAASTVAELEQVLVPQLKERAADGKLSATDKRQLQALALKRTKDRLTPAVQKQAGTAIADLDGFLRSQIEQTILEMRSAK